MDSNEHKHSTEPQSDINARLENLLSQVPRPGIIVPLFVAVVVTTILVGSALVIFGMGNEPERPTATDLEQQPSTRIYEEQDATKLDQLAKQADYALIEAFKMEGLDVAQLKLLEVDIRRAEGGEYHFQKIQTPPVADRSKFLASFDARLTARVPGAILDDNGTDQVGVIINGEQTHIVMLVPTNLSPAPLPVKPEIKGPKLVIVIDDIGENMNVLRGLLGTGLPIGYAVWPYSSHTTESVRLIKAADGDLLLHQPMEPRGYPDVDPGPGALFVGMNAEQIENILNKSIDLLPGLIGVNNHMGSRFTAHGPGMRVVLETVRNRGIFFLDSVTTGKSAVLDEAAKLQMSVYRRDVFIDNVKDPAAIILQLRKAERIARSRGYALAIGHPYPATLAALQQWNRDRDKRISVISISDLSPIEPRVH